MTTLATRPVEVRSHRMPALPRRRRAAAAVALKLAASVALTLAFAEVMSPMG